MRAISKVRGVRRVENQLASHESADDVPELQGESRGRASPAEAAIFGDLSPGVRLLACSVGAGMVVGSMRRGGLLSLVTSGIGLGLCAGALAGTNGARGAKGGRRRQSARSQSQQSEKRNEEGAREQLESHEDAKRARAAAIPTAGG